METYLPLRALIRTMEQGVNARSLWGEVLDSFRYNTVLTKEQERLFKKVFRLMAGSPAQTRAFLGALRASMMARPRVTRRFLEQVLPPEYFPRSLHAHAGWKDLAFILDYLRYLILGTPSSKKFGEQLAQYVESRQQQYQSASSGGSWQHVSSPRQQHWQVVDSPQQKYHSARSLQQQQQWQQVQGGGKKMKPRQASASDDTRKNKIFDRLTSKQERVPHFYFQVLKEADQVNDDIVKQAIVAPIVFDMINVYTEDCPGEKDEVEQVVAYLQNGLRMTYSDLGNAYLVLNEMKCVGVRDALFSIARLNLEEMLRRREKETGESVDKKKFNEILDYMSAFPGRSSLATYLWSNRKTVIRLLEVMGWPVPELSWKKVMSMF